MIDVRDIRKRYDGSGGRPALDGLDLTVAAGTVHGLLGPNGAGKTTLVRILATLVRPDGGTATVAGHDVVRHPAGSAPRSASSASTPPSTSCSAPGRTSSCSAGSATSA